MSLLSHVIIAAATATVSVLLAVCAIVTAGVSMCCAAIVTAIWAHGLSTTAWVRYRQAIRVPGQRPVDADRIRAV